MPGHRFSPQVLNRATKDGYTHTPYEGFTGEQIDHDRLTSRLTLRRSSIKKKFIRGLQWISGDSRTEWRPRWSLKKGRAVINQKPHIITTYGVTEAAVIPATGDLMYALEDSKLLEDQRKFMSLSAALILCTRRSAPT